VDATDPPVFIQEADRRNSGGIAGSGVSCLKNQCGQAVEHPPSESGVGAEQPRHRLVAGSTLPGQERVAMPWRGASLPPLRTWPGRHVLAVRHGRPGDASLCRPGMEGRKNHGPTLNEKAGLRIRQQVTSDYPFIAGTCRDVAVPGARVAPTIERDGWRCRTQAGTVSPWAWY